jgi:hypothetical protein
MSNQDRGAYLGALLAQRVPSRPPYLVANDVTALRRAARSLERLAVADCNHGLTAWQERRREALSVKVKALASGYTLDATCHGDPRGLVVKLVDPENPSAGDSFGSGWGVF